MSLKNSLPLSLLLGTFSPANWAEITLDGSLGRSGALIGPNYAITADLGKQIGGNLFHSFHDFNLDQHESATFSGPNTINNVISRVTGGNPSQINGRISSIIPHADVYLLNPAGIMFGESAKLDVQGGFHASTADTLRLGENGEFNASNVEQSVLTVAVPSAFGFLKAKPAAITLENSQLAVPIGKTLSLIGGNLYLNGIHTNEAFSTKLSVESGRLNLASLASPGEVIPTQFGLDLNSPTPGGAITASGTQMEATEGGQIFIRGGGFKLKNSQIKSETFNHNGGAIDIRVEQFGLQNSATISTKTAGSGKGGNIFINVAGALTLTSGSEEGNILVKLIDVLNTEDISKIYANSEKSATGYVGNIEIQANQITLTQGGQIVNETKGTGKSGDIIIKAGQVNLKDNAEIRNVTLGTQASGSITLLVTDALTIQSSFIGNPAIEGEGKGGDVKIEAGQLILTGGGQINSATFGSKEGGSITIKVEGDLIISGSKDTLVRKFIPSGILAESTSEKADAGDAGNIKIEATQIRLTQLAEISSSIQGQGKAGNIEIKAHQINLLDEAKIHSKTEGYGKAGTIIITTADTLTVSNSSKISTDSGALLDRPGISDAGEIEITAQSISLDDYSTITSNTTGKGGTITLDVKDTLIIQLSEITTLSRQTGNAGKINIVARQLKLAQGGEINSTTYGSGKGGSIKIKVTDTLTASGKKGIFGSRIFSGSIRNGDAGDAGVISIEANKINLITGGIITTKANNASGGNINIIVPKSLYLQAGAITTDVRNGQGDGGKIEIAKPDLVVLNNSEIRTNADQGWGGKINITADKFIRSANSLLDASSKVEGKSGGIKIEAEYYLGDNLTILPKNFLTPPSLHRCETPFTKEKSRSYFGKVNRMRIRRDDLKEGVWGSYLAK